MTTPRESEIRRRRRDRGQSLVEFALVAPVLILLALIALDFGRIFLGWVDLQNMARVGANFAALHPTANWSDPADADRVRYNGLMLDNGAGINCTLEPGPSTPPPPTFPDGTEVGDRAVVSLACGFTVMTPIVSSVTGSIVKVVASSSFPITGGCLAECPPPPPSSSPAPPPDNCRDVPDLIGLSVAGARAAWTAAGFTGAFSPATGDDTQTVTDRVVTSPPEAEPCTGVRRWFGSSVSVVLAPVPSPNPPTCITVPNVTGVNVAAARAYWAGAGFTGAFTPPPPDHEDQVVISQLTTPASSAGDCLQPDATMAVVYEAPPPPPPPPPCQVPSFVNTDTSAAIGTWTDKGFIASHLTFKQDPPPNYIIKSQTLVGGTWVSCGATIQVAKN